MQNNTTRDRLVAAGSDLFYQQGFQSVGLDQIIDQVGVTKTTFYNHFESKDALIIEILRRRDVTETDDLLNAMRDRAGDDPRAQLVAVFDVLRDWFCDPSFRGCFFMNAAIAFPQATDPVHIAAKAHGVTLTRAMSKVAQRAGAEHPEQIANQVMLLISGALASRHLMMDMTAAATARSAVEMLVAQGIPVRA